MFDEPRSLDHARIPRRAYSWQRPELQPVVKLSPPVWFVRKQAQVCEILI